MGQGQAALGHILRVIVACNKTPTTDNNMDKEPETLAKRMCSFYGQGCFPRINSSLSTYTETGLLVQVVKQPQGMDALTHELFGAYDTPSALVFIAQLLKDNGASEVYFMLCSRTFVWGHAKEKLRERKTGLPSSPVLFCT